ncbi:hypothetical protein [Fimbriimonas ginsengisoli]|uniref:Uncharacterized protein n=1 Tax=Fimbriimonas ginsengisoli Gsoil 348 TaxID=661478 RepID=A0A068NYI6_FIMGI|nr:hypothetical protein [Fimbriimonas ginsengisoli]AIE86989.1 hypothetical protein OP10G_3621 [Fimbriimonas ginsengisoli Gsoil 348]
MTVQNVIDAARERYPEMASAVGLTLFNQVHRELCSRSQLRNKTELITLNAGTQEYDLEAEVVKIHEAYHERSADPGDWLSLVERSTDEYAVMRRNWRALSSTSSPTEYYVTSAVDGNGSKAQIGFWPNPAIGTDGISGYPRVRLYCTSVIDLSVGDLLPPQILNENVYLFGIFAKFLVRWQQANQNDLALYRSLAEEEMSTNVAHIKDVQSNKEDSSFVPGFVLQIGRVI